MLRLMLDAHPNILIPPEAHFIKNLYSTYGRKKSWSLKDKERFIDDLQLDHKVKFWRLDYGQLRKALLKLPQNTGFRQVCDTVYSCYSSPFPKKEIEFFGDKAPNNSLYLDLLLKLYPDAIFIHLVRDYRDVIEAFLMVNFESHVVSSLAYRWNMYNEPFLRYQRQFPDKFYLVRYEDLVANPEKEMSQLLSRLNLSFSSDMLRFHETAKEIKSHLKDDESHFFKSLDEPINTTKVGRWRTALNEKQIRTAEHICGKLGQKLGYEPEFVKHPKPHQLKYLAGFALAHAFPTMDRLLFHFPLWVKKSCLVIYNKFIGNILQPLLSTKTNQEEGT